MKDIKRILKKAIIVGVISAAFISNVYADTMIYSDVSGKVSIITLDEQGVKICRNNDVIITSKPVSIKVAEIRDKINADISAILSKYTNKKPAKDDTSDKADNPTQETKPEASQESYSKYVTEVVKYTNEERAKAGIPALKISDALCKSAQGHAEDMYKNKYFSHTSPDGKTMQYRISKYKTDYRTLGENIACGHENAQEVVKGWMSSEGHRANILNKDFTEIGVGYCNGYWVQNFAG